MRIRIPNSICVMRCSAALAVGSLKAIRWTDPHRMSDFAGNLMRRVGPKLREHRIGQDNLRLAFPEKSDEEIETILSGVWDNLGRIGIEFAHLDRIWDHDPDKPGAGHIEFSQETRRSLHPPARRRQARAGLCRASGELGNAGFAGRGARPAERGALPRAQYRRGRRHGAQYARREYGPADQDRPRRADASRRCARRRQACRHAGRPILCARRSRDVLRAADDGQSADRAPGAPDRLPDPRHARRPPARASLPRGS